MKPAPDMESLLHGASARRSTTVIGASFGMNASQIRTAVSREPAWIWEEHRCLGSSATAGWVGSDQDATKVCTDGVDFVSIAMR